jgi:DNA-binding IclR family transcriptional regulator
MEEAESFRQFMKTEHGRRDTAVTPSKFNGTAETPVLQTVFRSLMVLDTLANAPGREWTLAELSGKTGVHKSSMLRILHTLQVAGYVSRDESNRTYRLGPSALALGGAAGALIKVIAAPILRELSRQTGETALLHVVSGQLSLCIDKVESNHPVRVTYEIGRRGPLYAGTSGKTLLAFMGDEEFNSIVETMTFTTFTSKTITDLPRLLEEMAVTRQRGYSLSFGELDEDVSSVGVPVWNSTGTLEAGISLVGPSSRWTEERAAEYIRLTLDAAEEVSRELGYRPERIAESLPSIGSR